MRFAIYATRAQIDVSKVETRLQILLEIPVKTAGTLMVRYRCSQQRNLAIRFPPCSRPVWLQGAVGTAAIQQRPVPAET